MLTTSPATMPSPSSGRAPSDTRACPVLTPMRSWSSACSSRIQSRMASAARTARSGSSSCATGAPKTAITASPMNFSTVPPKRSSSSRRRAWYGRRSERTSSGSICSARDVKPTRSAKRTVTTFRSSSRVSAAATSGAPHALQKRAPSGFSWLQREHVIIATKPTVNDLWVAAALVYGDVEPIAERSRMSGAGHERHRTHSKGDST